MNNTVITKRLSMIFFAIALGLSVVRIFFKITMYAADARIIIFDLILTDLGLVAATALMFLGVLFMIKGRENKLCTIGSIVLLLPILASSYYWGTLLNLSFSIKYSIFVVNAVVLIVLDGFIRPKFRALGIIGASLVFLYYMIRIITQYNMIEMIEEIPIIPFYLYDLIFIFYGVGAACYTLWRKPRFSATPEKNMTWYQQSQQNNYTQNQPQQNNSTQNPSQQYQYRQYQPPQPANRPSQPANQPSQPAGQSGDELEKKLEKLKELRDRQLITEEEYSNQVHRLMNDF